MLRRKPLSHWCGPIQRETRLSSTISTIPPDSPPPNWPTGVAFLTRPRLARGFPRELEPLLCATTARPTKTTSAKATASTWKFAPRHTPHPPTVGIKLVTDPAHPAKGQRCLVARKRIAAGEMIIAYLGEIHASFTVDTSYQEADTDTQAPATASARARGLALAAAPDPHADSDYDLSLVRLSASDPRNPFPGVHVSIGVDAARAGNAARFVNDFRGVASAPNAEFRLGVGQGGEVRMEVWATRGIGKGDEVLVSYGKAWWGARRGV